LHKLSIYNKLYALNLRHKHAVQQPFVAYVNCNKSMENSWRAQYTDVVRYEIEIGIFEEPVE